MTDVDFFMGFAVVAELLYWIAPCTFTVASGGLGAAVTAVYPTGLVPFSDTNVCRDPLPS